MTIELHTWNTPNGRKISVALEEMGLPYKVIPVNISKGEQMAPAFLEISPNNRIPAIVDPDGPGGKPVSVFESGAILLYLGEKTGKFLPKPLAERIPVYEWLMWQMGGFGPMPGQVHHFIALENERTAPMASSATWPRRAGSMACSTGGWRATNSSPAAVGRRFRHPRLGLAARAPQGRAEGFSQRQALVRRADGAAGDEAGHGSEAGLERPLSSLPRGEGRRLTPASPRTPSQRKPASTVPISQRWTISQVGRVPRKAAIEPAAIAIIALTKTLIAIWIAPSAIDCVSTLPAAGSMNCGSSAR